jgi:hypothetical protein
MKITLLLLACLTMLPASALAEAPVEVAVTGFKAKLDAGRVILTWRRYKRDDFASYVVVKSDKDSDPSYPGSPVVVTFVGADGVRWVDGKLSPGTWNYRLVITSRFGDRWVSPVVPVVVGPGDLRRAPPVDSDFE